MPFQSEKQRRYLHANHPEIAKRWERDYADGGITRIPFFKGAQADTKKGKAMSPGTSASGGTRHGGGGGGGDGPPSVVHKPKGPTAAEIAAAKAKAEAEKKAAELKAHKKYIRGFKDKQKKKKGVLDKWKDHATASEHMDLTGFGTHEKKGYNFAQNFPTISKTIGPGLAKAYQYGQELGRWGLGPKWGGTDISFVDAWKKGGKESDANIAGMEGKGFDKEEYKQWMKEQGYTAAKGGVARKKYSTGTNGILDIDEESEDISLTAFNPKFDDVPQLTDEEQLQIDSEEKEEGEKRIDLFSETEESDPLNNLLLAEDGVTTLFRAKNGGYAVQGGVKNYLGEQEMVSAPKYWQSAPDHPETELTYITKPEKNLLVKADLHGSLHGNVNKGPQGITSLNGWGDADDGFGSSGDTSDGGWGNDPQGEFGGIDSGGWDPGVFSPGTTPSGENVNTSPNVTTISGGDIWDWDDTSEIDDVYETFQNVKHRYDKNKTTQGWKMVINMLTGNLGGIVSTGYGMHKDKKAYEEMLNKLKQDAIDLGIPEYNPHTDTLIQTIDQEVIDINTKQDTEPQESDGPEPVAPVIKELTEYEQMAWDPMSYLDKIRAGQAQRASLQAKGIIQDNEIMTLNSGGLANLFTVKNYN